MSMKKFLSAALLILAGLNASAQQYMRVWSEGESTRLPLTDIVYTNDGKRFSVGANSYATAQIDSITIVHSIDVTFNGSTASVNVGGAKGVTYEVNGANVIINNENVTEEMEFRLSGSSTNGSLTYNGAYKCKFILSGLNLTSTTGAPLDIQCGKRVDLILTEGTTNVLSDAALGSQKACLYCKGHMEVSGAGSLKVTGNARHAIATKEYLQLKSSTGNITIEKAASDAIHAGQYFQMNGGTLNISGMAGDGIQAEATTDATDELNGQAIFKGGNINITVASTDTKGIKSDSDFTITGGTFKITASGAGSKGMSCSGNMLINQDTNTTDINVTASGKIYTDDDDNDTRCMGIKVDGNLKIDAGTVVVTNSGTGSRGIKVDGTYSKGANAVVKASVKN